MIGFRSLVLATVISASYALLASHGAKAFDLTGAWATSSEQCTKVFARKGRANSITFTNFSGAYGRGFIVEADRLRGKSETCKIKSRNETNRTVNLLVACASGIMLSDIQFFVNVIDENTISRAFPGIEGMDVKYQRCQI